MAELPPLERAKRLAEALLSERGEASGAAVARELLAASRELDAAGRAELFRFLADEFRAGRRRGCARRPRPGSPSRRRSTPPASPTPPSRRGRSCCGG